MTITVLYSCHKCGLKDVGVELKARTDEDLMDWMDMMGRSLSADHDRRSPGCVIQKLSYVKIPMAGRDRVGGPMVQ